MHVLNLVTNAQASFFRHQVSTLSEYGVRSTTIGVGGERLVSDQEDGSRSLSEYLKFYARVLGQSLGDFDLVHANYGLTAPMALAQPTRPIVLTLWGSDLMGRFEPLTKACARHVDAVIVMTEEMEARLDVPAHVIPHGVDMDLFRPYPQWAARERVGWTETGKNVLFPYTPGRPVKDYSRAQRIVGQVQNRCEDSVHLRAVNGVDHESMPWYYSAADAMLLTSKREGSPNSVKEAMACNLPVVATDVGDLSKRLDGVEPSAVCRSDADLVSELCEILQLNERSNGRAVIEPLGLEVMAERIFEVYESVLSEGRS